MKWVHSPTPSPLRGVFSPPALHVKPSVKVGACIRTANICKTQKTLRSSWIWLPDCKQWMQTLFCVARPQEDGSRGLQGPGPSVKPPAHNVASIYITHTSFLQAQKKGCLCSAVFFPMCIFPLKNRNAKHSFSAVYMKVKEAGSSILSQIASIATRTSIMSFGGSSVFSSPHFPQAFLSTAQLQELLGFNAIYPKWTGSIIQLGFLVSCYHPKTEDLNNLFEAVQSAVRYEGISSGQRCTSCHAFLYTLLDAHRCRQRQMKTHKFSLPMQTNWKLHLALQQVRNP